MKPIANIMTILAVFGWFLQPALAICCADCEQCVEICNVAPAPKIVATASCCGGEKNTCDDAPELLPTSQGCCDECQCNLASAPEAESMMATVIVQPETKQHLLPLTFATVASDASWAQQHMFLSQPKPPGDPPGRQMLLQNQILRL